MDNQNSATHFGDEILPDGNNAAFLNDERTHERYERSGNEFGDLFRTLLDPENHDATLNNQIYLPPFLERNDFQHISNAYAHHEKPDILSSHGGHDRSVSMHSVNPEEIFQSPSLLPRKQDEGMPSSLGSVANSSLFSTPMEDGFTPLISPITTPLEMGRNGPLPPEFSMPSSYMNSDLPSRPANSSRKSSISSRRAGSGKSTPTMGPSNSRISKVSSPVLRTTVRRKGSQPNTASQYNQGSQGSSSDSVSPPDQLDDIVMPPPSVPNNSDGRQKAISSAPATPASLMNMPAGASAPPFMTLAEERVQSALAATNNASSRIRRSSSSTSMTSSISPILPSGSASRPKISSANNWKAQKSSLRSPAIKPKIGRSPIISPNIAPKKAHKTSDSGDLVELLASKSNYQNIIEGNHNQLGLEYPENLSVDLVSKKTSHKIAEQGRRNRINNALTELAQLISPTAAVNSKASTVESAISLIKDLQSELKEMKIKLEKYEGEMNKD